MAAENFWWHPGMTLCWRCYFIHRYEAYAAARKAGLQRGATSQGTTTLHIAISDSIAAMLGIGLPPAGATTNSAD